MPLQKNTLEDPKTSTHYRNLAAFRWKYTYHQKNGKELLVSIDYYN